MFRPGEMIGPFLIEKELGSGAMGTVFRVRYTRDDRKLPPLIALKIVSSALSTNESMMARFDRETEILKQLRHPHVVRFYANGKYKDVKFFAMEYVDGDSLDRRLTSLGRLDWALVLKLSKQLCLALQHAHDKGIIHRDLKPSNLMVTRDDFLKLTDFGIAKDMDLTALTAANNTLGTAAYMSPEQCRGEKHLTNKSDLYSLGICLYELITGQKPFQTDTPLEMFMLHVNEVPIRPRIKVPDLPMWFDTLIMQLLEKKPEHRPRDAAMVAEVLEEIEQKAMSDQSIGADAVKAKHGDAAFKGSIQNVDDREAIRAIQAGAKRKKTRKKKGIPFYRKPWFGILAALGVLATVVVSMLLILRPDSPAQLYARIEAAKSDESRKQALENYLRVYGSRDDELTQKVKRLDVEEKVKLRIIALMRRYGFGGMKNKPEDDDDKAAYERTMQAIAEENDGDTRAAADHWGKLAEEFSNDPDPKRALWGHVGQRKKQELAEIDQREQKLKQQIESDKIEENERPFDPNEDESKAIEALRLELLGDPGLARIRWQQMREARQRDAERRSWFLLAGRKTRDLLGKPGPRDDDRVAFVTKKLDQAKAIFAQAAQSSDTAQRKLARDGRIICREVRDLYRREEGELQVLTKEADALIRQNSR